MLVQIAKLFARWAHRNQVRKYTGEPYFVHLEEVAECVRSVKHTWHQEAAAYLHDTVEDTGVRLRTIRILFGKKVARMVEDLTDISKPSDGNRAARKAIDLAHTAAGSAEAKTVKLADICSNSKSIIQYDPKFAKVYMVEKERQLEVLTEGDPILYKKAEEYLRAWKEATKM